MGRSAGLGALWERGSKSGILGPVPRKENRAPALARHPTVPCPLCGYHAPELACPHCRLAPAEPSLAAPRGGFWREVADGLLAVPMGAKTLLATPRTKRLLVPPVVLTSLVFGFAVAWCVREFSRFFEAVRAQSIDGMGLDPGLWRDVLAWLAGAKVIVAIAHAGSILVLLTALTLAALWTFSIAYEAICGPFLDTVQARVEKRWFGADPRVVLEQQPGVDEPRSLVAVSAAAVAAAAILAALWLIASPWAWLLLLALPLPFLAAARVVPGSGAWLSWFVGSQARMLWISVKASLLAALIMIAFLWVKLIPLLGLPLFAMVAGWATALTLLDIPFSRRGWTLSQRLTCLLQHLPAVLALGIVTSLVFVVPLIGPLIGVPCASIGGQWLVCRIDKNRMRPPGRRIEFPRAPRPALDTGP